MAVVTPISAVAPPWLAIIVSVLTALGSAYAYSVHLETRLSVVETKQDNSDKHVEHIDQQVDRLVEWALGRK